MRNLLLITDFFPPAFAPRMGYLCKWLARNSDWRVIAVYDKEKLPGRDYANTFEHLSGYAVREYPFAWADGIHGTSWFGAFKSVFRGSVSFSESICLIVGKLLYRIFHRSLNHSARVAIRRALRENRIDLILCSTTVNDGHALGAYAAKLSGRPIIQDLRDIEEQVLQGRPHERFADSLNFRRRNRILLRADSVVTVSKGLAESLRASIPDLAVSVIYNGYDPDVFTCVFPEPTKTFNVVYIGSARPDGMDFLMRGLERIVARDESIGRDLRVCFYTAEGGYDRVLRPVVPEALADIVCRCECVQQKDLLQVLRRASVLVVGAVQFHGSISTKVFEYISSGRPVMGMKTVDACEQSELILTGIGNAVVQSADEVVEFLRARICEWRRNGLVANVRYEGDTSRFSRASECEQYLNLMDSVSRRHRGKELR